MDIIKEIFYGNIHPNDREVSKGSESDRLIKLIIRYDENLISTLDDGQKEIYEKLRSALSELSCLNECEGFVSGFRLAAQIMLDALKN